MLDCWVDHARTAALAAVLVIWGAPLAAQDFALEPAFGEVTLSAGFSPDPHTVELASGGPIDASTFGCSGFIAEAPDYRIQYSAGSFPLIMSVLSDADTTLVVNDPLGEWICNDDYDGFDPAVFFDNPVSGQYDIWIGTFGGADIEDATLFISEILTEAGSTNFPGPGAAGSPGGNLSPDPALPIEDIIKYFE